MGGAAEQAVLNNSALSFAVDQLLLVTWSAVQIRTATSAGIDLALDSLICSVCADAGLSSSPADQQVMNDAAAR